MSNFSWNKIGSYFLPIIVFLIISFAYFSPILQGKRMQQSDVSNYLGMSKEISDYSQKSGKAVLWTNSMFGGMPSYLINIPLKGNFWTFLNKAFSLNSLKPVGILFLYLLGFYFALLLLGYKPWLSFAGAIAFAFSTYFLIILEPGHITKAFAIGYMPVIVASIYAAYKDKPLLGTLIFGIFFTLQLSVNHVQITYYTFLIILLFLLFEVINTIRTKQYKPFIKTSAMILIAAVIAVGCNITNLWLTYEYSKYSTRSESELSLDKNIKTKGLDKDYVTAWSYGIGESLTLLVPNAMGGASYTNMDKNSDTYQYFKNMYGSAQADQIAKQIPTYWGSQPFTSGPVYIGAVVFFLFILGMFYQKGWFKWWLFLATLLSIMLAWGKNMMWLTDFFLDYIPGYDKFRTVSMILVIAEFTMPFLAITTVYELIMKPLDKARLLKSLKWTAGILGGILLLLWLVPGMFFNFSASIDSQLASAGYPLREIISDREGMFRSDAFRSLVFVIISAGIIYLLYREKIKNSWIVAAFAVLFLVDLWPVNKRYVHNEMFVDAREAKVPFKPTDADMRILQDPDPYYRVLNVAVNTFNDASTSYFHKSIGGYHGAKMKRYQELIEHQISQNNFNVLNMLNTKYIIYPDKDKNPAVQLNPQALGNAWFVQSYRLVENADSELTALSKFNPATEAIVDKRFASTIGKFTYRLDSAASIRLTLYHPDTLKYQFTSSVPQFTVFSDIYYDKGWNLYIDGKKSPYFRVNYVLRAAIIPAGNHQLAFIFEPSSYFTGEKISLASSILLLLFALGIFYKEFFRKKQTNP